MHFSHVVNYFSLFYNVIILIIYIIPNPDHYNTINTVIFSRSNKPPSLNPSPLLSIVYSINNVIDSCEILLSHNFQDDDHNHCDCAKQYQTHQNLICIHLTSKISQIRSSFLQLTLHILCLFLTSCDHLILSRNF